MATQTTYYEFNKPAGSDLVNPLTDTNPNWDIADAALHELNVRSFANATETVVLGVHAISRINQYTKFIKWIATANFTAGDTFTVDGNVVAASTPSGAALATGAYVTGSVVIACLNADDTAMTIFVSGTNVATDSERLGGELPSYYATASDMTSAQTDIGNIQALNGTTSIVGIGDGTLTGAVSTLNTQLTDKLDGNFVGTEEKVGKWLGADLYRKCYEGTGTFTGNVTLDSSLTTSNTNAVMYNGTWCESNDVKMPFYRLIYNGNEISVLPQVQATGLKLVINGITITKYTVVVYYTKIS